MAWQQYAGEFAGRGYGLAALAVDAPVRAATLREQLGLTYPILCDPERVTVQAWNLYNRRERGGIAVPATVVLTPEGRVELFAREGLAQRLAAREVLAFVASGGAVPRQHGIVPRLRCWWRAFIH